MKKHIVEYVSYYLVCLQVKIEYQRLGGILEPLEVL